MAALVGSYDKVIKRRIAAYQMKPHLKELCFCRTPRPSAAYPGSPSWTCPGSLACTPRSSSPRREWPPAASCMDRRVGVGSNLIGAISWWDMDSYTVQKKKKKSIFLWGRLKKRIYLRTTLKYQLLTLCAEKTRLSLMKFVEVVFFFFVIAENVWKHFPIQKTPNILLNCPI